MLHSHPPPLSYPCLFPPLLKRFPPYHARAARCRHRPLHQQTKNVRKETRQKKKDLSSSIHLFHPFTSFFHFHSSFCLPTYTHLFFSHTQIQTQTQIRVSDVGASPVSLINIFLLFFGCFSRRTPTVHAFVSGNDALGLSGIIHGLAS